MNRKLGILAVVLGLFLALLSPGLVQAQGELTIVNSSAEVGFPYELDFTLSARSDVDITDIRLHYQVDRMSFARVTSEVYIEFVPAASVEVDWSWDMRKTGGLPPGSGVLYWWTVENARGDRVGTAPVEIEFSDNRYPWRGLTEGKVTIYWYQGEDSFAQELMTAAQQALNRLAEDTGAELEKRIKMYIYADTDALRGAMVFPQEWTGGVAFTRYGILAIGIAPDELDWGRRTIAHELTHLVVHQVTLNPYSGLPTWLNEGLAMHTEGEPEPIFINILDTAAAEGNLISVRSLSSPFSAHTGQSLLSYAQSYSIVDFLITEYGQGEMLELLNIFNQGSGYDGALEGVYGFDMDGLDALWQDYIAQQD